MEEEQKPKHKKVGGRKVPPNDSFEELTYEMRAVIPYFLVPGSIRECCAAAGIGTYIFYKWMAENPGFKREIIQSQRQMIEDAKRRMICKLESTAQKIFELSESKNDNIKLRACEVIFEQADKLFTKVDIIERLESLEKQSK